MGGGGCTGGLGHCEEVRWVEGREVGSRAKLTCAPPLVLPPLVPSASLTPLLLMLGAVVAWM